MRDVAVNTAAILEVAAGAVSRAAVVCRHVQARLEHVRAMTKDDRSPVTIADYASQAVVARELTLRLPDATGRKAFVLVAEESADFLRDPAHAVHLRATLDALDESGAWPRPDAAGVLGAIDAGAGEPASSPGNFWTLDPIDGTKGFLRGEQYCISLALVQLGEPAVGALGCPNLSMLGLDTPATELGKDAPSTPSLGMADSGALFTASRGGRAAVQPLPPTSGPIAHPPTHPPLPVQHSPSAGGDLRVAMSVDAGHTDRSATSRVLAHVIESGHAAMWSPVRLDSQCKYAVVARGDADAYLRLPTRSAAKPGSPDGTGIAGGSFYIEKIWDHAAGALVATEAGCIVSDIFGHPLDFRCGRELTRNRGVICAGRDIHPKLIEAILALGIARD